MSHEHTFTTFYADIGLSYWQCECGFKIPPGLLSLYTLKVTMPHRVGRYDDDLNEDDDDEMFSQSNRL
jgi:hypothetical protein